MDENSEFFKMMVLIFYFPLYLLYMYIHTYKHLHTHIFKMALQELKQHTCKYRVEQLKFSVLI